MFSFFYYYYRLYSLSSSFLYRESIVIIIEAGGYLVNSTKGRFTSSDLYYLYILSTNIKYILSIRFFFPY